MKHVTLQAFGLILSEIHETRLERHTFLAQGMKKCDNPSVLLFLTEKSLFYLSETPLFPTPTFPADPPDPADPVLDPPDPGKMVPELALRPSLPRAPGIRMT